MAGLKFLKYSALSIFTFPFLYVNGGGSPSSFSPYYDKSGTLTIPVPDDSTKKDTSKLPYPFHDRLTDPYSNDYDNSPLYGTDPSNINGSVEYNPETREYDINERLGNGFYRNPSYMTFEEFKEDQFKRSTSKYWKDRSDGEDAITRKPLIPKIYVGGEAFDRIFGGNTIDIRPQGSATLDFAYKIQRTDNPQIPEKQRRVGSFEFNEQIQMNVIGNIGEKMKLSVNYNTEASFDFENQMKLEYTGYDDEIIRKIEAGNVSLPLTGSLIRGSQSLFGIKTQLQFGRLGVTSIFSQQKGQASTINVPPGGGQLTQFEIESDQYEENRHFFISQYFYDNYDKALADLPTIRSNISISKIEVWVTQTNFSASDNTRDLVALQDLGEYNYFATSFVGQGTSVLPSDTLSNNLYQKMTTTYSGIRNFQSAPSILDPLSSTYKFSPQQDYELITNAKKLTPSDFTYNERLGYISLNSELRNDQALAVAFEYTVNGKVYRVGELTTTGVDPSKSLIVKLVRGRNFNTALPSWKLMMKNVYNLNAFQISKDKFKLDVLYFDNGAGSDVRQLPEPNEPNIKGKSLIRVLNTDNLNSQGDATSLGDGVFDFVEGLTVNSATGRIFFPSTEPFGRYLEKKFVNQVNADKYTFKQLYDSTKTIALAQGKNKFKLKGSYQSSSGSEISLNAINIPQGSVKVTSGGVELVENTDYTVDYNLGRVKIINSSVLNSATPIQVSLESNSLFAIQTKTLLGSRFDYKFNKDFSIGGTIMRLTERPITQKVNVGDEPIANTIFGVDGTYRTQSRFITKLVDKLPFISTKEISSVSLNGEFAYLLPGHPKAIGKTGNAYIDDFEGTQSPITLTQSGQWYLASVPRFNPEFPEFGYVSSTNDTLGYGYNRAKLSWYNVDASAFYRTTGSVFNELPTNERLNNNAREILESEIFPNRTYSTGQTPNLISFDFAYYPDERGPYNYDVGPTLSNSAGTDKTTGKLLDPQSRWGGIMRKVETSNFEESNIQYIQLWMMDPYNGDFPDTSLTNTGTLYFNLGDVSEDILRDGAQVYENGLPKNDADTAYIETAWGRAPSTQPILYTFPTDDQNSRPNQDVGLDGLKDDKEVVKFQSKFLDALQTYGLNGTVLSKLAQDPSSDDFSYFRNDSLNGIKAGVQARYKNWNGTEGNSPVTQNSNNSSTTIPDAEDINRQNGMEVDENYFQYKVEIDPAKLVVGQNYVSDMIEATVPNGSGKKVKYYLIKIPVNDINREKFGQISDLKSVKFIRVFAKGFENPIVMRFARFEFLRGDWRKYDYNLAKNCPLGIQTPAVFDVGAVSLEENGDRVPINYVLPPDFQREIDVTSTNQRQLNEQSLSVKVCELANCDLRGVYKNTNLDMRNYKHVKMVIHAESFQAPAAPVKDGDVYATVRLGSDFTDNYYEYRIPLKITPFGSTDPTVIWPKENDFDIDLTKLTDAKLARNNDGIPFSQEYRINDGNNFIVVKGNPTLSEVRVMMLGVWNPYFDNNIPPDDGDPKCVEVWFNEFRMTGFNEQGGWATIGRAQIKLADLGNISVSGGHSTHGFGSLESKLAERSREDVTNYDVATSLELGKFFPTSIGLTIPVYLGYGEVFSNPQYDPLDPDIEFTRSLNSIDDGERKKNRRKISQDYTRRKSLNFTNVKKNKVGKNASKSHLYDIENFNFTYGYTEVYRRNISTEYDLQKDYLGAIGYNFNTNPKPFTPFSKIKGKSKYWRPLKDFNVNYMPTSFNFRWDVNRHYGETQLRDVNSVVANNGVSDIVIPVLYDKRFTMNRQYGTAWDITKSLKFDFNANNQSKVDEPEGSLEGDNRDSVRRNFFKLGRNTDYMHDASLSYNLPFSKLPITDWINATARYTTTYHWTASPLIIGQTEKGGLFTNPAIGNTIQNSNTKQGNVSFNMTSLYSKWKFYKKLTAPPKPKTPAKKEAKVEPKKDATAADSSKTKTVKPPVVKKEKEISAAVKAVAKLVFSLKTVSLNYNETNGLLLPGFNRQSEWLGQNWDDPTSAPGFAFTFGSQDEGILKRAAEKKWLTTDEAFNSQFTATYMQNITGRASLEPITGLNIDLNISRNYTKNTTQNYRAYNDPLSNGLYFDTLSRTEGGNFSMSYFTWKTAFIKDRKDYTSSIFETFANNRQVISDRLGKERGTTIDPNTGYRDGYSGTSQDVLILSFLSAYTKTDPSKMKLDLFPSIPKPNWTVRYDGLSKLPFAKKLFQSVNLTHGYRSTYSVNTFTTDVNYFNDPNTRDINNDFIAQRQIGQVSLAEQYSPLLGIDITWKNAADKSAARKTSASTSRGGSTGGNISTRVEFKRDRTISLALAGIQITEVKGNELTVGVGYRIPNFKFPFGLFNSISSKKANDLNTTLDFSIRKNNTVLRKLVENTNQPTSGLTIISIKLSSDYTVNERLNLRFFFDKVIQTPVVSTSYPNSNTSIGISIRFTLSQ